MKAKIQHPWPYFSNLVIWEIRHKCKNSIKKKRKDFGICLQKNRDTSGSKVMQRARQLFRYFSQTESNIGSYEMHS